MRYILIFLAPLLLNAAMLLGVYKDQNLSGWVMSEKYDGVRAIWDGKNLKSRNNLKFNQPSFWSADFPPFWLDGEIYTKRGDFERISSIVASTDERWKEIVYLIFDVPNAKGDLFERLAVLQDYLNKHQNLKNRIKIIEQIPIKSRAHAFSFLDEISNANGEGVVLRNPKANYENTRSKNILKLKKFYDAECEITAINEGKGKLKGRLGFVLCKDLKSKLSFKIGSGFSDDERALCDDFGIKSTEQNKTQAIKSAPKCLKIGDIITYKYQNLTKNKKPRFPVFLRIRNEI